MLDHEFLEPQGILVLKPSHITQADVAAVRSAVSDYLTAHADIRGLLIETRAFPGWENLAAVASHLGFVADYHAKIRRVALVTDMNIPPGAEGLIEHLVGVTARRFPYADRGQALRWLES
jgi:hypothetical protein